MILHSRGRLQAGTGVYAPRPDNSNCFGNVRGVQSASDDNLFVSRTLPLPRDSVRRPIEQNGLSRIIHCQGSAAWLHTESSPHANACRRCAAVDLGHVELRRSHHGLNRCRGFIHKHSYLPDVQILGQLRCSRRLDVARALGIEDETQRRRPGGYRSFRIFAPCDAAHLHHHDCKARNAAAGFAAFMRCSPTRNAWKPASWSLVTAARESIPLSLTLITPAGIFGANLKEVSRVTSNVCRLRLLTPIISAPESTAAASSASSWTSTSAAIR